VKYTAVKYKTPLVVAATAVVIAACALLWYALPQNTQIYAPFEVRGTIGSPTVGRGITATVTEVQIAPRLGAQRTGGPIAAAGMWVVVTTGLDAGASADLARAELLVGPNTYAYTERLIAGPAFLQPGITQRRAWAFDVAPDVLDAAQSVALRIWVGDARLDSRLVIEVPLDNEAVHRGDSIDVPPLVAVAG